MWIKPNIVRGLLRVWEERLQLPIIAGKGQWLGTPVTVFLLEKHCRQLYIREQSYVKDLSSAENTVLPDSLLCTR